MTPTEIAQRTLTQDGRAVGTLDKDYALPYKFVIVDEILGPTFDPSIPVVYAGRNLLVRHVQTVIGLQVTMQGARGPLWQGVLCEVLD